jgi:hypothetical protein
MGRLFFRSAARGRQIKGTAVVAGLIVALLVPLDLVLCTSADGHAALENAWLGCCQPVAGTLSCAPAAVPELARSGDVGTHAPGAPCSDIRFGVAARASSTTPQTPQPHTLISGPALPAPHASSRLRAFDPDPAYGRQVREALSSTVLAL